MSRHWKVTSVEDISKMEQLKLVDKKGMEAHTGPGWTSTSPLLVKAVGRGGRVNMLSGYEGPSDASSR
jgi:hypothetical protein